MNKQKLGILAVSLASIATVGVITFSSETVGTIFAAEGEETTESITFSRATSTIHKNKTNTTFEGRTSKGATMYLLAGTSVDLTTNFYLDYVAYMSSGQSLTITSDSAGKNQFEFQCLKSITLNLAEANNRKFSIDVSTDGMSYQNYEDIVFNGTDKKTTLVENGKYFRMTYHNDDGFTAKLDSIVIEYTCSSSFIQDPKPNPTQADAPNRLYNIYGETMSEAYGGAPIDGFTDKRITYKNRAIDPSNYACVYNSNGEVVKYLKKGLCYTSTDDVANYILAFGELPPNYDSNRYCAFDDYGEYGRTMDGYYGLDHGGSDGHPKTILPKSTDGNYYILDIGWKWAANDGATNYSKSATTNRGPLKMVIYFKGVRAEGEDLNTSHYNDGNPVIFYTPDNFKSAFEYANYFGGWSDRFNQGEYRVWEPLTTK